MPRTAVSLVRLMPVPDPGPPDAQLLRAFVAARGEDVFAEIVRRHGPMVLAACRRVLGHADDADDAFQAVFLVLARKAGTIRGANLAGWLYAVAVRTARGVRIMRDRRRKHELRANSGHQGGGAVTATPDGDLAAVIDEELTRLPESYREAVVLCELRGLSRKEAAAEIGIPEGTLSSRLAAAKRKLAARLSARGLSVPAALAAVLAPASVSSALVRSALAATHGLAAPVASAAASAIVKAMLFDQLKAVTLAAGLLLTVACGGWAMTGTPGGDNPALVPRQADDPAAKLVARLGSEDFADREAAQKELRTLGAKADAALKTALKSENPEVRDRAAKLLTAIRRDSLDALAKNFDPAKDTQPDHPVWTRFKTLAGDSLASRALFAQVIRNAEWLRRLDAAELGLEAAARQYREACVEVGKHFRSNMTVWFEIPVWPCDRGEEAAFLLLLGSYPGTESAKPKDATEGQQFSDGEGRIHFARGLEFGLQGKMLDILSGKFRPDAVAVMPGTDRVFAKLLGAWLARRDDTTAVYRGFELAVKYRAADVLAAARAVAGDKERGGEARCAALAAVAQFGTPDDLRLFPPLFDDTTMMVIAPPSGPDIKGMPRSRRPKVHDRAIALALLLCDRDPFELGFVYAKDHFRRENGRPVIANYEAEAFGFPDAKARETAHAKAKEFLATQMKKDDIPTKGAKVWPRFAKTIGEDAASRSLFDAIVANPKNLELLEKVTETPDVAGKLYHDRWQELNKAARIPTGDVGSFRLEQASLADALGWMYLGTFAGTEGAFHQSYSLDFLPMMPPARTARDELRDAIKDRTLSAPLRRLLGKWTATRVDYTGRDFGLQMALAYDIQEVLPAARTMLTTKVKDDPYPGNTSRNLGFAMLVVGKFGTKDDLPLLERYAKDEAQCATVLNDPPPKPGEPVFHLYRPPTEGRDATAQLRDVSAAMRLHLSGQKPHEFGFHWSRPFDPDKGKSWVKPDDVFNLYGTGFLRETDREAAHKKAREWFGKQSEKEEPKKDEPDPAKLVEQLGNADFADREAAEKKLKELGARAKPAVLAGLKAESPEVVRRCRVVLDHIRREEAKAAFLKVAGDDDIARTMLIEVLKDSHRARVLDEAVQHPERSGKLYAAEQWRLWQKAVSTPPGAQEADIPTAPEIALSFFLGTHPSSADTLKTEPPPNDPRISEGCRAVESGLLCKSLQLELIDAKRRGPFVRLMAAWMATRSDPWLVDLALSESRQYRLPEVVPVARQVARNAKLDAQHRAVAALALADLGGAAELPTLATLMDDKTEWSRVREGRDPNGPTLTVQLRDVAVGAALLLSGQDPGEFGFPKFRDAGVAELKLHEKLGGQWFAFVSDTDREAAHKKVREWFDKQKQEEPAAGLLRDLADLDSLRNGEQTDFAAVEKRGEELLAKYPGAADRGRIYTTLTRAYANSGIGRTFARVTKYGRFALEHDKDPVSRGLVFSYLASAAEVAVAAADPLSDEPFAVKRKRAAGILLEGYRELLPLKLPDTAPELPGVEKIGGLLNGTDPAEEARIRERHAAQIKARQDAVFVSDMVHRRDTYAMQLKYLYGRQPKADDELKILVAEALKDPKAATDLLDRVAKSR